MVEFMVCIVVFFFKQKTAYEMRISDWSSDVCSSDLIQRTGIGLGYLALQHRLVEALPHRVIGLPRGIHVALEDHELILNVRHADHAILLPRHVGLEVALPPAGRHAVGADRAGLAGARRRQLGLERSEAHTSALQSLMRISYAVYCCNNNNTQQTKTANK